MERVVVTLPPPPRRLSVVGGRVEDGQGLRTLQLVRTGLIGVLRSMMALRLTVRSFSISLGGKI